MLTRGRWFLVGLFLTTFSTLAVEIIDTRLLSVSTWYHLSFFAVSTAMFGMAAGAVRVYLGHEDFDGDAAPRQLARYARLFAVSIPLTHVISLCVPIPGGAATPQIVATLVTTLVLAVPFYLSGIVVAIALTRIPGPSGLIYAVDLLGAALGAVGVLLLFEFSNIASAMFTVGTIAALGAACFERYVGESSPRLPIALAIGLFLAALVNDSVDGGLRTIYAKGSFQDPARIEYEYWTIHGQVSVAKAKVTSPFLWTQPKNPKNVRVSRRNLIIDGAAATVMTRWSGAQSELSWIEDDVTALPYHLRKGGHNAVIGVGGGRDILAALWGKSESVTGIEINEAFLDLLQRPLRNYARLADDPRVRLVHDEGRSYLTRTKDRYDVLQMSLIDTWAATGAGAFTLSENGLYTVEAWKTFIQSLTPGGLFSVSRWYSAASASETSRLVALAAAALLETGASVPADQMILVSRGSIATLVISNQPMRPRDLRVLPRLEQKFGFEVLMAPSRKPKTEMFGLIANSGSIEEIERVVAHSRYDYTPPTDERPYFFNILKPGTFVFEELRERSFGVIGEGNLLATLTLGILWLVVFILVTATILVPLAFSGLPQMASSSFSVAVLYFALIGMGFMFVQIPLMQRFSVYLGHPTYSLAVILFSMILATGVGSLLSDSIETEAHSIWLRIIPLGIGANLLLWTLAIQPIIDGTIEFGLAGRIAVTVAVVSIAALPLGFCFPIGLRLVRRISADAMPWMWGVNGAAGVLASVTAVAVSMWSGISTSLFFAVAAYSLLVFPALWLWHRGAGQANGDPR